MKKITVLLTLLLFVLNTSAQQQFRIWQGEESSRFSISNYQFMTFSENGAKITIGSNSTDASATFNVAEIDSIVMIHQVKVAYDNSKDTAIVTIPETLEKYVTAEVKGAHVIITNTNEMNEVECELTGEASDGSFTYIGSYKSSIRLAGVNLTSNQGAAIDIKCGKRIALILEDGTENTLVDYVDGAQKACLYCKGHLEVEGGGTLNVTGNLSHAIKTKEYLQLKKSTGTINIVKSNSDGIHVGQYYRQDGGTVNITSTTYNDGIQAEIATLDDDVTPDPDKEFNGQVFINGGSINIEIARDEDQKAIKCDSLVTITGGTLTFTVSSNGSRGIQTEGSMIVGAEGSTTAAPIITITATGGLCTKNVHKTDPHRCMGIKVEGDLSVYSGVMKVIATGSKGRSIKVTGNYNKYGGTVYASPSIKAANL